MNLYDLSQQSKKKKPKLISEGTTTKHRIGLTVTDPNHPMVSKRDEPIQKTVRVPGDDPAKAINAAIAHYRRKGYKVHDHHYMGTVEHNVMDEAAPDWLRHTAGAATGALAGVGASFPGAAIAGPVGGAVAGAYGAKAGYDLGAGAADWVYDKVTGKRVPVDKAEVDEELTMKHQRDHSTQRRPDISNSLADRGFDMSEKPNVAKSADGHPTVKWRHHGHAGHTRVEPTLTPTTVDRKDTRPIPSFLKKGVAEGSFKQTPGQKQYGVLHSQLQSLANSGQINTPAGKQKAEKIIDTIQQLVATDPSCAGSTVPSKKIWLSEQGVAEGGYQHGFADPNAPSLGGSRRKDDEGNSEFDDRIRRQTGMIFYNVNDPDRATQIGLKQTRTGKWYLRTGNRHAQQTADRAFGIGRIWYPESVQEAGVFGFMSNEPEKPVVKKPKLTLSQIRDLSKQEDEKTARYVRSNDLPDNPDHMRVVHDDVELGELSNELLGRYKKELGVRARAADRAGDYDAGHEYFKKINRATIRQGDNDARKHAEKENEMMETRLNMMRKAGYDL